MLSQEDKTEIQKIALREIMLVAVKLESKSENDSETHRVAQFLRHYANERLGEVASGDLNRPY